VPSFSKSPAANSGGLSSAAFQLSTANAAYDDAAAGVSVSAGSNFVGQLMEYNLDEDWYSAFIYELLFEFDTATSGSIDTGVDVVLKLYLLNDYSTSAEFNIEVYALAFGTSIDGTDWQTPSELRGLSPRLGLLSTSGIGSAGLKSITLDDSAVNLSGPTRLIVVSNRTRDHNPPNRTTQPTGSEYIQITIASCLLEYTTVASDPSVPSVAEVGVTTQSTVRPEPSVGSVAQVGVTTRSDVTVVNNVTVDARAQVGVTTRSTVQPEPNVASVTEIGVTATSTVRPEPSVATVAATGVSTYGQPTVTVSVVTVAAVGAVLQSGTNAGLTATGRVAVGVVVIATSGTETVVTAGPIITFREPAAVGFDEPAAMQAREPGIVVGV
jgi:hypothetical protein